MILITIVLGLKIAQIADLHGQEKQTDHAQHDKQADPGFHYFRLLHQFSPYISAVSTKSQAQHGQGRINNGTGRRPADPLGSRQRIITLEQGDPSDNHAEYDAFDDTVDHIIVKINLRAHLRPKSAIVHAQTVPTPTKYPPITPIMLNSAASSGMETTPAKKRGEMMRRNGSTAIISIPDNCSVAFMMPISAVSADPARPANSKAVTTGPNSLTKEAATITPRVCSAPKSDSTL